MAKAIKKPINKGVCKVPVIIQMEALECGAACLTMILAYYNKWIPLEQIRTECGVSRDGSNARNILRAAKHHGLEAKGYRMEVDSIVEDCLFPCIIHWNFNHFVVLDGFKNGKAYLNDPAKGAYSLPMKDFDEAFTGIVLVFEPGESFKPTGRPKNMFEYTLKHLKGTGVAIAFSIITAVISSLMGVVSPLFSRVFIDRLLQQKNLDWFMPFIVLLVLFNIIELIVLAMQAIYSRRIDGKIAATGNLSYMWKVLHLPMNFFTQRMAGDIQSRQSSNAQIANVLINMFIPLILQSFMMVFYLIVMIRYSVLLTVIGLLSLLVNGYVSNYIAKKRADYSRVAIRDSAKLNSATIAGIEMVETIKASGAEESYFAKWAGYQASVNNQEVKAEKFSQYLGIIPTFVSSLTDYLVLIVGIYLIMQGEFTVGMVMAFQGFLTSFMAPAQMFIGTVSMLQQIKTEIERVEDVMNYKEEDVFAKEGSNNEEYKKLSGNISLRNITFGYSPLGEALITDFNLELTPGKTVALVGGSGCGKSTISKLVSGLFKPWSGEILFDGKPLNEIDSSVFHGSLAVVDQDIILFEDTIANNIKMWDSSIEDFEMIMAARDAKIHEDIIARPDGYKHKLIEGGKDFSGGQRQRLEIARVLAQDPTIIILDEATSALDAKTEYEVVKAIKERGITCIVIAHRLSTIRSCDEIIVMEKGHIIDRGTHKELMETSKLYKELVTSE